MNWKTILIGIFGIGIILWVLNYLGYIKLFQGGESTKKQKEHGEPPEQAVKSTLYSIFKDKFLKLKITPKSIKPETIEKPKYRIKRPKKKISVEYTPKEARHESVKRPSISAEIKHLLHG